jgi:ubiquinone/menaquinone biosynthesis C-methylase UbiE/uncharacterized protein YbaR (Trm112 family)
MFMFLLEYLRCPNGGNFSLITFVKKYHKARKEDEIIEGILVSKKTKKIYPIVNGIPRLLPTSLIDNIEFCERYKDKLKEYDICFTEKEIKAFKRNNEQVKSRFEFQWKIWGKSDKIYGMTKDEYKYHLFHRMPGKPIKDEEFKGKIFFEGGCGHGMVSQMLSPLCREYIGLDIGSGIECARWRSKSLPNVHLIQGDLLNIPIKDDSIDFVFSNGVIHHTPNTYKAFCNLAKITKKKGNLMIWVYPKGNFLWEYTNRFARFFTTKLPPKMLYYLSYPMIPILYIFPAYADNRPGKNTPKELTQSIYDWLSPFYQSHHTPEEIMKWFKRNGFKKFIKMKMDTGGFATKI